MNDDDAKNNQSMNEQQQHRIAGIGVAMPFELWNWAEKIQAPEDKMKTWRETDFVEQLRTQGAHPVFIQNDATSACGAELFFGQGGELTDFMYFFIGTFIGGGVVINHSLYSGRTGNAGAVGPMPVGGHLRNGSQLMDHASIFTLENELKKKGIHLPARKLDGTSWESFGDTVDWWVETTGTHLAVAIASCCSVIDFEAVIIEGNIPEEIKHRILKSIEKKIKTLDFSGIETPQILAGTVGRDARALGAASLPLFSRYLLDQSILFKTTN